MARGAWAVALLGAALWGCSSSDGGVAATGGGAANDGGPGGAAGAAGWGSGGTAGSGGQTGLYDLSFVKPAEGQVHVQGGAPPTALVSFEVLAGPGVSRVEYVIENEFSLGVSTQAPGFALDYAYQYSGNRWARALGFDGADAQVAEALVNFVVEPPTATSCMAQLDQLGVQYTTTVAKGVVDGVKLQGPLNGILFAKSDTDQPTTDPMACEFVLTLWTFAELLKAKGFTQIGSLGSYCYRCCCAWSQENYCRGPNDPEPDCSQPPYNGFSNHSWGRAIDIRYLYKKSGEVYDVNDPAHWVEWPSSAETCGQALAAQTGISKELYSLVCEASVQKIFGIVLTPNYNSAHRNHFHADIGQSGTPGSHKVLSSQMPAVDVTDHPDE